jgi:hypothetical protein
MTKPKSIQPPSKPLRKGRKAKNGGSSTPDPCEQLLAELQIRRERLQHLLSMIHFEAGRSSAAHFPLHPSHHCTGARHKPDA